LAAADQRTKEDCVQNLGSLAQDTVKVGRTVRSMVAVREVRGKQRNHVGC